MEQAGGLVWYAKPVAASENEGDGFEELAVPGEVAFVVFS